MKDNETDRQFMCRNLRINLIKTRVRMFSEIQQETERRTENHGPYTPCRKSNNNTKQGYRF